MKKRGILAEERQTISEELLLLRGDIDALVSIASSLGVKLPSRTATKKEVRKRNQNEISEISEQRKTTVREPKPSAVPSLTVVLSADEAEKSRQRQKEELSDEERMHADFEFFCSKLEIPYRPGMLPEFPDGGYGPFMFNYTQRKLKDVFYKIMLLQGKPLRIIILKSRQLGCTTFLLAFWVWLASKTPHYHIFFMIDKDDHLRTKRKTMLRWLEKNLKAYPSFAGIESKTGKILTLTNESIIFLESAESTNPGTSEMIHVLHESEKPKWKAGKSKEIKESVKPALPDSYMSAHVDESTAHGMEDFYYKWKLVTRDPDTDIVALFFPWWVEHQYRATPPADCFRPDGTFIYSDREEFQDWDEEEKFLTEEEYAAKYKLDPDQIYWRRRRILDAFEGNRASFDKEYPTTPEHAFRGSSNQFFLKAQIKRANARMDSYERGYLHCLAGNNDPRHFPFYNDVRPEFVSDPKSDLFVRFRPDPKEMYFIGADVAEGREVVDQKGNRSPDWTVFTVKDRWGVTQAQLLTRDPPEHNYLSLLLLARWYNNAFVNGERNGVGFSLLSFFWQTNYPRNIVKPTPIGAPAKDRAWTYLHKTDRDSFLKNLRSLWSRIPHAMFRYAADETLGEQVAFFVNDPVNGKAKAQEGFHDDLILSEMHAYQCIVHVLGPGVLKHTLLDIPGHAEKVADVPVHRDDVVALNASSFPGFAQDAFGRGEARTSLNDYLPEIF